MNTNTVLGMAVAALGFLAPVSALFTIRAIRGWRARCLSIESSLAAVRRELELVTSIMPSTLLAAAPIPASSRSSSG